MRSEWKKVKVADLGKIVTGKTPKTAIADNYGGKIPFLTPSDDMSVKFVDKTKKTITDTGLKEVMNSFIPANSVCVSCIGSDLGKAVISRQPMVTNQQINSIIVDQSKYDVSFVYYSMLILGKKLNFISKTSTAVPIVNKSSFSSYTISCPTLEKQRKIASILSSLDAKIELNQEINENLERQARAMFNHLFIENANPSWPMGTICDLGTVVGGSTPSKSKAEYYTDKGIAWITPKDLSVNKSKFISHGENDITESGLKNSSATIMPEGTVLFSSRAPIGYIAIAAGEVTTNQGFKSVVPKPEIGTAYVYYFLKHSLPTIEGMASGSTFKEVSCSVMKSVPAQIPDDETLAEFNNFCGPLFAQQKKLEEECRVLAELRDTLLPKLMAGEIDVQEV